MRRLLLSLGAALLLAAPAFAKPPMWVVKDGDSELVLFGSVHVLPPGLDWRRPDLDAAIAKADDLWFELPVDAASEQEVARLAASLGILPPGQSLFRLMPPKDAQRLMKVADAYGTDKVTLDHLEPWLAEVAVAAEAYRKAGANADNGVEKTLSAAAPAAVQRRALETPAEQLAFFDQAPLDEQLASLRETVRELDEEPGDYLDLVRAWMDADVGRLDREALQPLREVSPGVFRRLVTERNARWVKILDTRLKGQGRTVVVVGVGHLVGPNGVPAQLRALGYSVTGP